MTIQDLGEAVNKGGRDEMQDITTVARTKDGTDYLGVFDGFKNYGHIAAEWGAAAVQKTAVRMSGDFTVEEHATALCASFLDVDKKIQSTIDRQMCSTATVAVLKNAMMAVVYIGDSEAAMYGDDDKICRLIEPHNGFNEREIYRLQETDTDDNYADLRGSHSLTRAIGAHGPLITARAEVKVIRPLLPGILILATDGVWGKNTGSHARVDEAVRAHPHNMQALATNLVDREWRESNDNAAVIAARIG